MRSVRRCCCCRRGGWIHRIVLRRRWWWCVLRVWWRRRFQWLLQRQWRSLRWRRRRLWKWGLLIDYQGMGRASLSATTVPGASAPVTPLYAELHKFSCIAVSWLHMRRLQQA
ncbi:hypothetical protein EXIGLDRAFT_746476 [Exidia glandulosa HHB12029]|uniref:Uncharacterized protein n=1 Tax=Exidia glandulosa HHB12029 TaxID=1314781 RepID=A0A165M4T2_EXIGL|nr:hypothetical protein EXIGLDRAFT_746476 [Exidia glandulosa HHB12029]